MMCWLQFNINSINHHKPWHCHLAVLKRFRVEPELIDFPSAYCWDVVSPKFWTPTRTVVGHVYVLKPRTFCSHPKCEQHCLFGDVNQLCLGFIWYRYQLGTDPYRYQFISHGVASYCTQFNQILLYPQYPSFGHLIAIKHYHDWIVFGFDWSFLISIWYYMYFFYRYPLCIWFVFVYYNHPPSGR